jgi:hypothetical protein
MKAQTPEPSWPGSSGDLESPGTGYCYRLVAFSANYN